MNTWNVLKWLSFANVILMSFFLGWQIRRVAVEADNRPAVSVEVDPIQLARF